MSESGAAPSSAPNRGRMALVFQAAAGVYIFGLLVYLRWGSAERRFS